MSKFMFQEKLIEYYKLIDTITEKLIWSKFNKLKLKNRWHHQLSADVISFFITRKCQKIQNIDKDG